MKRVSQHFVAQLSISKSMDPLTLCIPEISNLHHVDQIPMSYGKYNFNDLTSIIYLVTNTR